MGYLGIIVAIALVVAMYRIADMENLNPWVWAGLALFLMFAVPFIIPMPFLNVLIAGVICYVAMTVYKIVARK